MYTLVYTLEYMDAICCDDLDFSKKLLIHISTTKFPCGTLCQVLLLHRKIHVRIGRLKLYGYWINKQFRCAEDSQWVFNRSEATSFTIHEGSFNSLAPWIFGCDYRKIISILLYCVGSLDRLIIMDFSDDKSTLFQVMDWCRQATSHYLSQCWPRSISPYGVTRPQWVKYCICNCEEWHPVP